ncbi:MAG: hypothetical protein ACRYG8_14930 [Janthinobacterium lividum]
MQNKVTLFSVYAPPEAGLPFLSVIFRAGRKHDLLVTSFTTASDAVSFNNEMRVELSRHRSTARLDSIRIPAMTPDQSLAARELLKWTRDHLSRVSGVGIRPLSRFEMSDGIVKPSTVASLRAALELAGIEFIIAKGAGAGVRMRKAEPVASATAVHLD